MTIERMLGGFTRVEWLGYLGIPDADDPKLAALAAVSWGGNANKALVVNPTENGWAFSTLIPFSDEAAQDAVGTILVDSATIDFTYSDATPSITAAVIDDSIDNAKLANMAQATIKGRASGAGTGDPTDLSASQVLTLLGGTTGSGAIVLAAAPSVTGGISIAGGIKDTGSVMARFENTGSSVPSGSTGAGVEIAANLIQAVDRTGGVHSTLNIDGSTVALRPNGTAKVTADTTQVTIGGSLKLPSYTAATVPSAAAHGAGAMIYVTDESGGAVPAFSDATNWRRVTDRSAIS